MFLKLMRSRVDLGGGLWGEGVLHINVYILFFSFMANRDGLSRHI